jgi:hypothetical protein
VPLAAFHFFACVVAPLASQFGGLDTLAIQCPSGVMLVMSLLLAHPGAQRVVQALPVSTIALLAAIPVHTGPLRILMGQHPPFDATVDDIKDGMDYGTHIEFATPATGFWWGINSLIHSHSASVRSVGYGLASILTVSRTDATYGRFFKQPLRAVDMGGRSAA